MSLPPAPEASFISRSSGGKPGRLRHPRAELCSCDKGPLQLALTSPISPFPAVTIMVLLGVFVVVPTTTHAQAVYGSIFGTITDQSGASVVGAKVTVTSVQKNTKFETITNGAGNYNLTHLIPDQYDVRSEGRGFKVVESTAIPVFADQAARVDVQLPVGGTEEELTVSE